MTQKGEKQTLPRLVLGATIPPIRRTGIAGETLMQFLKSGAETAEVVEQSASFGLSLRRFLKEHPAMPIVVHDRGERLFLERGLAAPRDFVPSWTEEKDWREANEDESYTAYEISKQREEESGNS